MLTRRCNARILASMVSAGALALAPTAVRAGVDPNKALDFRVDAVRIVGATAPDKLQGAEWVPAAYEGDLISVHCDVSANLVSGVGYWQTKVKQTLQAVLQRDGNTMSFATWSIPAGTELGSKSSSDGGYFGTGIGETSTTHNYGDAFKSTFGPSKWTAKGLGKHQFQCVVPKSGFVEPSLENNVRHVVLEVVPKPNLKPMSSPEPAPAEKTVPKRESAPASAAVAKVEQPVAERAARPAGPPTAGSAGLQPRATILNIEAEESLRAGRVTVTGGRASVQSMAQFGRGWSGDMQLLWSGAAPGAVLALTVDAPVAGEYAMEVYLARAPDYGDVRATVNGRSTGNTLSRFSPRVGAPSPTQAGRFPLKAGPNAISFEIVGKQNASSGYLVGIDRIRFYPTGR